MEAVKRFLVGNLILFLIVLIVLPPIGVILFGLFFVPILIVVGFTEAALLVRAAITRKRYTHG